MCTALRAPPPVASVQYSDIYGKVWQLGYHGSCTKLNKKLTICYNLGGGREGITFNCFDGTSVPQ